VFFSQGLFVPLAVSWHSCQPSTLLYFLSRSVILSSDSLGRPPVAFPNTTSGRLVVVRLLVLAPCHKTPVSGSGLFIFTMVRRPVQRNSHPPADRLESLGWGISLFDNVQVLICCDLILSWPPLFSGDNATKPFWFSAHCCNVAGLTRPPWWFYPFSRVRTWVDMRTNFAYKSPVSSPPHIRFFPPFGKTTPCCRSWWPTIPG